jgi:hypothetical protein
MRAVAFAARSPLGTRVAAHVAPTAGWMPSKSRALVPPMPQCAGGACSWSREQGRGEREEQAHLPAHRFADLVFFLYS